jgi:hypothetical protein
MGHFRNRSPIIDIARGQKKRQEFALVVHDEMQFEAIEPAHGGLAAHLLSRPIYF